MPMYLILMIYLDCDMRLYWLADYKMIKNHTKIIFLGNIQLIESII